MNPSVRLMVCLLSLYGAAMVMFWYGIAGHKPAAREEPAGRLALKAGQTIVGVVETAKAWHLLSAMLCGMRSILEFAQCIVICRGGIGVVRIAQIRCKTLQPLDVWGKNHFTVRK